MNHFWKILANRAKLGLMDFLTDVLVGTIAEWRRASKDGALDLHNQQQQDLLYREPMQNTQPNQQTSSLFGLFKRDK